jgi:cysteine desulfurase
MSEIYLDYAAATPVAPEVLAEMEPFFSRDFANPASNHAAGARAKQALEVSRNHVAQILGVEADEIIFTASGTASLNTAVLGVMRASEKPVLWASPVEHNAVLEPARALETEGKQLKLFKADSEGRVGIQDVGEDTALVSVMLANNEVGTIQDIPAFAEASHAAGALMHTDASQAAPTVRVRPRELGVDLLSLDGQKIYGPKGVGILYAKRGVSLKPFFWGSGQERGMSPGTENVAAIVGVAAALKLVDESIEAEAARLRALRNRLEKGILAKLPESVVIGAEAERAPHISTIAFPEMERDVVQAYLSKNGIYVSTGAACDPKGTGGISHVLEAMGIPASLAEGALRISLGRPTTEREIEQTIQSIVEVVGLLKT